MHALSGPLRRVGFVLSALLAMAGGALAAEPEVYYFGATGCEFCANGLAYLKRLAAEDTRVRLKDFDIIADGADAAVFIRVTRAIGLNDPQVPMTVIGHHVIIGYESDQTTGAEIRATIEQCRASGCPDLLRELIGLPADAQTAAPQGWIVERRFASSSGRR
jgi:glutaredoxin